ncbi:peritrophin-48 [Zeugodacus cucurbitae]|uniref:Peritrophin-48 n=1 Tax=Zeugodacus cucurbitae TaxID=28588 RepID=A0A0A1X3L5_ZEUCU|nr:peritrophin-48 [Zeugodacus cucurbitae]
MTFSKTSTVIVFGSLLLTTWFALTISQIQPREANTCEGRQTTGNICESCELLSTCVRNSSGWMIIPIEICDISNGFYCNSREGVCSNKTGPCHPFAMDGNFPCTSQGIFPDPYDCQKYHMCYFAGVTLVSVTLECFGNKAFNAATGQCTSNLQDNACKTQQFQCANVGDAHPWPNNPNVFYICRALSQQNDRILYPSLYRCPDGEVFNGHACQQGGGAQFESSTTKALTTPSPTNSICAVAGLSADPDDCTSYYYCSGVNGVKRHHTCPLGTHFSTQYVSCVIGACRK